MFDEDFIIGDSLIHRLDPRLKVLVAISYSLLIAVSSRWAALVPGLLFSVVLMALSRASFKKVFSRLVLVNGMILFLWFFLPFSIEGMALFTFGPLKASREGVLYATLLTLRSNTILLVLMSMVSTNSIFALGRAMSALLVPDKMVQLFFFTYRYLHVIELEYQRLAKALKIRGFRPKTNMHTYRTYAFLVGMLLVRSYDRSERVKKAMFCRGFRGRFYTLKEFQLKAIDILMGLAVGLAMTMMALLQWTRVIY